MWQRLRYRDIVWNKFDFVEYRVRGIALLTCLLGVAACAVSAAGVLQQQKPYLETVAFVELIDALESADPEADEIVYYISDTGRALPIHVFHAAGPCPVGGRPGLVMYHGGSWKSGSPTQFSRQADAYSELGFSVFLPAYSLESVDGTPPQQALHDAISAWETIGAQADGLCLNRDRLGAGGGSAGGQLGAALVTAHSQSAPKIETRPRFLVLFNPVIDNSPAGYGQDRIGDDWTWFSPLHNIPPDHPDTIFLLGDEDILIPATTGEEYCLRVQAVGADCQLVIYEGAGHGWFNTTGFRDTLKDSARFLQDWLADSGL